MAEFSVFTQLVYKETSDGRSYFTYRIIFSLVEVNMADYFLPTTTAL